jgi:hypothetical protein
MSNYSKATNFATKDSLSTGNPSKIVKGTEIDTEFNAIASAISSKVEASDISTAIAAIPAVSGRIVQIVDSVTATGVDSSSDSLVATGHTATITPTATTSKILILTSFGFAQTNLYGNNAANAFWTLYRGSTNLGTGSGFGVNCLGMANVNTTGNTSSVYIQESYQLLDSPATVSAVTYQTYVRRSGNASAGYNTMGNARIILLEISQ